MFNPWPHQQAAIDAVINHCKSSSDYAILDECVSSGKTNIIAHITDHVANKGGRVLNITAVKELVEDAIETYGNPGYGVCCASLDRKEIDKQVTFSSVQTLVNNLKYFKKVDLILIDEVHNVNDSDKKTSYMKVIKHFENLNSKLRVIGLSGTPFRFATGLLVGKKRLFKKIIATTYIKDLIKEGLVTKPVTPHSHKDGYDFSNLKMKMGKFVDKEVNEIALDERLTKTIIRDAIDLCKDRKKVIVFCSTLQHAKEVENYLNEFNQGVVYIDGKLNKTERENVLYQFHNNPNVKFLVNKSILGTGYSFKEISAVIILRRTESLALLIQLIGRGLRLHPDKENCLILDYASNFDDINDLLDNEDISAIAPKNKKDSLPVILCPDCGAFCGEHDHRCKTCGFWFISKTCPECDNQCSVSARYCDCGEELIDPNAPLTELASGASAFRARVLNTSLSKYQKPGSIHICLRIDVVMDDKLNKYPSIATFIPVHTGLFKKWVKDHIKDGFSVESYDTIEMVLKYQNDFNLDKVLTYQKIKGKKYFKVVGD